MQIKGLFQAITVTTIASSSFVVGSVFGAPALAGNLIVNGSFEEGDYSSNIVDPNFARLRTGSTALTGWTVEGAGIDWHNSNDMQFPVDGDLIVDLNLDGGSSGILSQTFATDPGKFYTLAFYLAGPDFSETNPAFPSPRQVSVEVAGVNQIFSTGTSSHKALKWELQEFNFQAIDTQTTLKFASVNNAGFWGAALDNVSVMSSAKSVPEHFSSIYILGFGSLGVFSILKRKSKAF